MKLTKDLIIMAILGEIVGLVFNLPFFGPWPWPAVIALTFIYFIVSFMVNSSEKKSESNDHQKQPLTDDVKRYLENKAKNVS